MDKMQSLDEVREFVLNQHTIRGDRFDGKCNVSVGDYLYSNVDVSIYYQHGYSDYTVAIMWEEDDSQPDYNRLGLRGSYSSNFYLFNFNETTNTLAFEDGQHRIAIHPCK